MIDNILYVDTLCYNADTDDFVYLTLFNDDKKYDIASLLKLKSDGYSFDKIMISKNNTIQYDTEYNLKIIYIHEGLNTRVEMIDRIRKCYIKWDKYVIAELYHEYASISGEFNWVIKPIWETWDILEKQGIYVDIDGIDEEIRLNEYIRQFNPWFVTQRTLSDKRPELRKFLKDIHLRSNDLFEVMCRTHGICGNNDLYVTRFPDKYVDVNNKKVIYDIPDYNTDCYGWIINGVIQDYGPLTEKTINCKSRI